MQYILATVIIAIVVKRYYKMWVLKYRMKKYEHNIARSLTLKYHPRGIQYYRQQNFQKHGDRYFLERQVENDQIEQQRCRMIISNHKYTPYIIMLSKQMIYSMLVVKAKYYDEVDWQHGRLDTRIKEVFSQWFVPEKVIKMLMDYNNIWKQQKSISSLAAYLFLCNPQKQQYFPIISYLQQNLQNRQECQSMIELSHRHSRLLQVLHERNYPTQQLIKLIKQFYTILMSISCFKRQTLQQTLEKWSDLSVIRKVNKSHYLRDIWLQQGTIIQIPVGVVCRRDDYSIFGMYSAKCPFYWLVSRSVQDILFK